MTKIYYAEDIIMSYLLKGGKVMPDDKTKIKPQDAKWININEEYEVKYWCKELGCTEKELIKVVNAVGDSVEVVKAYLGLRL